MKSDVSNAIQLPNGDLFIPQPKGHERPDTIASTQAPVAPSTPEEAVEAVGDVVECNWCGMEVNGPDELLEHLYKNHAKNFGEDAQAAREAERGKTLREKAVRFLSQDEAEG